MSHDRFALCPLPLLLGLVLLCAGQAGAGAWPRPAGQGFFATDARLSWPRVIGPEVQPPGKYYTGYLEYGLTDRITAGLDLGRSVSGSGKTVGFLRVPLTRPEATLKISVELGLGRIDGAPVIRPGLSIGRGFSWGDVSGWLAVDSLAEIGTSNGQLDAKIDMTFGVTMPNDWKYLLQLQTGAPYGDPVFARLAPSVVIPIGPDRYVDIGGHLGLTGDNTYGLKLGVWQKF